MNTTTSFSFQLAPECSTGPERGQLCPRETLAATPRHVAETMEATTSLFPQDLGEWLDDAALARLSREAAETFYWISADDDDDRPPFGGCQCPLRKLALLTYCYARGCYPSEDIAALLAAERGLATTNNPTADSLSPTGGEGRGEGAEFAATLRHLSANAQFPVDKLRLFRSHNSELLKLTLAFVCRRAWNAKFGESRALRDFLLTESASRLQRAIFADRVIAASSSTRSSRREEALANSELRIASSEFDQSLVTSSATRNGFAAAAIILLALLLFVLPAHAAETLPPFTYEGKTYTNAVVIESNPVDVLIRQEELGFKRLKRQEMPAELKDRFPYDAREVEDYEKQQTTKAKARREQIRADAYAALIRQEAEIQVRIDRLDADLAALQKEIKLWRAKPNHPPKRLVIDRLLDKKLCLIRYIDELRKQLEGVRKLQAQYR